MKQTFSPQEQEIISNLQDAFAVFREETAASIQTSDYDPLAISEKLTSILKANNINTHNIFTSREETSRILTNALES